LRVHVAALRKALGDGRAGKRYIANNPGRGYAFVAPVTREHPRGDPASADGAAVVDNLPAPLTRIIGRDDTIAGLATQLGRRRFLTIVGPGGIGKTTLAVAVADIVRASYKDGVWFVGLASLANPDLVASALAAVLGIPLPGLNPVSGVTASLRNRQALIVLDNCEHVIDAAAALAEELLRAAPRISILATSREPLRAEGEWLHRLASLALPPGSVDLTPGEALRYPAVELFDERAGPVVDGFALGEGDVPAVLEICRKLDGVPLAIELAAARVDAFGVKDLAVRLDNRFTLLTKGRRTALPRHQTLRATLDWSYELLAAPERVVLRRLAIFAGGFTLQGASAVAADDDIAAPDVIDCVINLVTKSLVSAEAGGAEIRYRLIETTRAYSLEKLVEAGEFDAVARRHARRYLDLFESAEAEAAIRLTDEWLANYVPRMDNLRAALDWAFSADGDATIGVALTAAAVPLWMHLSLMEECRRHVERALAAIAARTGGDARCEMQLHAALATSLVHTRGEVPNIGATWKKALEIAESLGDVEYQLRSLWGLWGAFHIRGQRSDGDSVAPTLAQRFYELAADRSDRNDCLIGE
jgi:predicted ATPase